MKKAPKIVIICLVAAIVVAAAAIGTVLIVHRTKNPSIETENTVVEDQENTAEQVANTSTDVIQFGSYPQTCVTDKDLIEALNEYVMDWQSFGYYNCDENGNYAQRDFMRYADVTWDGKRYRAVIMDDSRGSEEHGYLCNTTYWFLYEPLTWRILDAETGLLLCDKIIDAQTFSDVCYDEDVSDPEDDIAHFVFYKDKQHSHYANDYTVSDIRSWLNDEFFTTAFSAQERQKIDTADLDNTAYPKKDGEGDSYDFNCPQTEDKIYLLSYQDMLNRQYGFDEDAETEDDNRTAGFTDYALIQGLYTMDLSTSSWMLRTPGLYTQSVCYVGQYGELYAEGSADASLDGIRPALNCKAVIDIPETNASEESSPNAAVSDQTASAETARVTTTSATTNTTETTKVPAPTEFSTTAKATTTAATAKPASAKTAKGTYTLSLSGDSGVADVQGAGKYRAGEKVTVSATLLIGYNFQKWASSNTSLLADGTAKTYSFIMPAGNVTLKAQTSSSGTTKPAAQGTTKAAAQGTTKPAMQTVNVQAGEGVLSVKGNGQFAEGASVSVSAVMKPGYDFSGWMENGSQISNQMTYAFKMPNQPVTLTAVGKPHLYTVAVKAGTGISHVTGSGQYKAGDRVTISASVQQHYIFDSWNGFSVDNPSSADTSFTMPAQDVAITASAKEAQKYTVTVEKAKSGFTSVSDGGSFYAGESVTVSCVLSTGYIFDKWISSDESSLQSSTAQNYSFTMPEADITLTAKAIKNQYKLTINKGTGISSVSGAGTYTVGQAVTVGCTPSKGYAFSKWTSSKYGIVSGNGSQSFTFNMPKSDVTLTAYAEKNEYTVTISKGSGIKSTTGAKTYTVGDTVTVTATASSGYVFDRWTLNGSTVSFEPTYTFTMPNKNVSLSAKARKDSGY